ncbi:MAG: MCE family protein, partial [Bdellovibrionales bacterium]|nr:MCE family protein [Bdellovibrionales bacterium]
MVQVSGLRAGEVSDVDLLSTEEVLVKFKVLEKFAQRVKSDSRIQVVRPFIIGEKVLDLSIGSDESEAVSEGGKVVSRPSVDLMDLVSGKRMNDFLTSISGAVDSFKILTQAISDPKRTQSFVRTIDRIDPLVANMNAMSLGVTKVTKALNRHGRIEQVFAGLASLSKELETILPELSNEAPQLGKQLGQLVSSMTILAKEFEVLTPALREVAPDLPHTSRRAVEALDEAVVLLKAMQKSFFLRGSVKEVKEEEDSQRAPASQTEE